MAFGQTYSLQDRAFGCLRLAKLFQPSYLERRSDEKKLRKTTDRTPALHMSDNDGELYYSSYFEYLVMFGVLDCWSV